MTIHLIDIASYQAGMDLAAVKAAGFSLVNIKTTQGVTYVHKAGPAWADKARALGMGISTFHWLDNSASGRAQADFAFAQIKAMGGPAGMAHQVDCEDTKKPATQQILRDYVNRMQDLLGRHVVVYTGDWWWQSRGWHVADLTPYVWAAPNSGYLASYPGDTSPQWRAGYGGWGDYALLQYAVSPIAGAGGGDVSKSAVRDPQVWAALTGTTQHPAPAPAPTPTRRKAPDMFIIHIAGSKDQWLSFGPDRGRVALTDYNLHMKPLVDAGVPVITAKDAADMDRLAGHALG